jgi:hypothetical protein
VRQARWRSDIRLCCVLALDVFWQILCGGQACGIPQRFEGPFSFAITAVIYTIAGKVRQNDIIKAPTIATALIHF